MAEFRMQASFAFSCSHAEMALLEEVFLAAANLADGYVPDPPSPELLAIFPPTGDDVWSGLRDVFTDPDFPATGADVEGGNSTGQRPDAMSTYPARPTSPPMRLR